MDWCNYSWNYSWVNVWLGVLMNANELADELREISKHSEPHTKIVLGIAESLLRQQQAEIEALETDNNQLRKEAQEHALEYLSVCGQADEHYEKARQQQAEIKALKQIIDANNLNQNIGQFVKPINEPVAWMLTLPDGTHDWILDGNGCEGYIPLYTHPGKELTDEEIMEELVKVKHTWVATTSVWFEFEKEELKKAIRAILRKAQEK